MYYTDSVIEQSAVQKLLGHLLPILCLLAMASTLNRLSLGYAAPDIGRSLDLSTGQLGIADDLFCVGYLLGSLPAAWLLLRYGARVWITAAVLVWGAIALAHALIRGPASLYIVHLLLGVAEANLLPAMMYYLTTWMPERHRAKPIGAIIAAAALIPVVAGEMSHLLVMLGDWFGINGWRFMFVMVAFPTLFLGVHVPTRLPHDPAEPSWLPASERHWLLDQLRHAQPPGALNWFADGLRSLAMWRLAGMLGVLGLVTGSLGMWVPLGMQQSGYVPPDLGATIMTTAGVVGVAGAVTAGLVLYRRGQWRWALATGLVLTAICLGGAAAVASGLTAVLLLAAVAVMAPAIAVLIWALAPCVLAGDAAASGFAVLGMAWMLGVYLAAGLAQHDAGLRCTILAVACLVVAVLVRGLDGHRPTGVTASAASPGE